MHQLQAAFILLFIYQLKHFIVDYPLQNEYMLGKFKSEGWVKPLAAHAGLHGLFTLCITAPLVGFGRALALGFFDFAIHFAMDRIKASPKLLGRYKALSAMEYAEYRDMAQGSLDAKERFERLRRSNTYFWWALGLDQMVHHLTHYAIIALVIVS